MTQIAMIACIITPVFEGPHVAKHPLNVNGTNYHYDYGKEVSLPENVVVVAEGVDSIKVERVKAAFIPASPAPAPTDAGGNGDGAAEGPGGADGSAASTPNPLDHDGDGNPGGSKPADPPALAGKTKKELLAIAQAEGVEATDKMTNQAITDAIEAKRTAG